MFRVKSEKTKVGKKKHNLKIETVIDKKTNLIAFVEN